MNDQEQLDVGGRIREIRGERQLSLRALAERCGLSVNAISRIERGGSSPTVSSLLRLATSLGVHITDLFRTGPEQSTILVRRNRRPRSRGDGTLMESLGIGLPRQILEPFLMTIEAGVDAYIDKFDLRQGVLTLTLKRLIGISEEADTA